MRIRHLNGFFLSFQALGSSPDLAQIRPLPASGQTLMMPQFITHVPNSSINNHQHCRGITLPQSLSTLSPSGLLLNSQSNTAKVCNHYNTPSSRVVISLIHA